MKTAEVTTDTIPEGVLATARLFASLEGFDSQNRCGILWGGMATIDNQLKVFTIDRNSHNGLRVIVDSSDKRETYELLSLGTSLGRLIGVDAGDMPNPNQSRVSYHNTIIFQWRNERLVNPEGQDPSQAPWHYMKDLLPATFRSDGWQYYNYDRLATELLSAEPLPELKGIHRAVRFD